METDGLIRLIDGDNYNGTEVWRIRNLRKVGYAEIMPNYGKVIPYRRYDNQEYGRLFIQSNLQKLINDKSKSYVLGVTGHGMFKRLAKTGYEVIYDS